MNEIAFVLTSTTMFQRHESRTSTVSLADQPGLLDRFISGDDAAFCTLFDQHHHRLYLYCLKLLGDEQQAEDLMQEVWERVIRLRARPQCIANDVGFLVTIARNLSFNQIKQQRRRTYLNQLVGNGDDRVDTCTTMDLQQHLQHALSQLTPEHREVLVLSVYCDYTYEEIGKMLGRNVTAIRMRASRARAQLRTILEKSGNEALVEFHQTPA